MGPASQSRRQWLQPWAAARSYTAGNPGAVRDAGAGVQWLAARQLSVWSGDSSCSAAAAGIAAAE